MSGALGSPDFERLRHDEAIVRKLQVMDTRDKPDAIPSALSGQGPPTYVMP